MKQVECLGAGKTVLLILKRKTAPYSAEKKILSKNEDKLIIEIPLVLGIRPIVVQPQVIVIAFKLEHVRIAVTIRNV